MRQYIPFGLAFAVVIVVSVLVGVVVGQAVTSDEFRDYVNQSEQWCENHGGELVMSNAIMHGGWHCQFSNGTLVHMNDVNPNST